MFRAFLSFILIGAISAAYHERQDKELCLKHSLNNLFQSQEFSKADLDIYAQAAEQDYAEELLEQGFIPEIQDSLHEQLTSLDCRMYDKKEGNYQLRVLQYALINQNYNIQPRIHSGSMSGHSINMELLNHLSNDSSCTGMIIHEPGHYTALRKDTATNRWVYHNSLDKDPKEYAEDEELRSLIRKLHQSKAFAVFRPEENLQQAEVLPAQRQTDHRIAMAQRERESEVQRQRETEEQRQREAEERRQRKVEERRQRKAEDQRQREVDEQRRREAEALKYVQQAQSEEEMRVQQIVLAQAAKNLAKRTEAPQRQRDEAYAKDLQEQEDRKFALSLEQNLIACDA